MLFKSPVFAQASGSVAGMTYSRNAGGMYVRSRAKPTNPNTEAQQAVRDAMRNAVFAWSNTLTDTQREVWNTYAFNTPTWNRLGESTHKTGQQMFIRGTIPRLQASLTVPAAGPTQFDLGDFSPVVDPIADASATSISIETVSTDEWALTASAYMFVYQSRPQNATRVFGKGPFQLAGVIEGVPTTGPLSPTVFTSLFPLSAGQRLFLKIMVSMPDGRLTTPQFLSTIVVA